MYERSTTYNAPGFVSIVTPQAVITRNTLGTGLSVLTAFVGGHAPLTVSKENMVGTKIEDDRGQDIKNPFLADYEPQVQRMVDEWLGKNESYLAKTYAQPLYIYNGHTRLIYEALTGAGSDDYSLHVSMHASKMKEQSTSKWDLPQQINCDYQSQPPFRKEKWMANHMQLVQEELKKAEQSCTDKIIADLPMLLSQ